MITKITVAKSFGISLPPLSCESQVRQLPYEAPPLPGGFSLTVNISGRNQPKAYL
jgi:hypothetical protein